MYSGHIPLCHLLKLILSFPLIVTQVDIFLHFLTFLLKDKHILRTYLLGILLKLVLGLPLILIFINDLEKGNDCELAGTLNQPKLQGRREVEEATT